MDTFTLHSWFGFSTRTAWTIIFEKVNSMSSTFSVGDDKIARGWAWFIRVLQIKTFCSNKRRFSNTSKQKKFSFKNSSNSNVPIVFYVSNYLIPCLNPFHLKKALYLPLEATYCPGLQLGKAHCIKNLKLTSINTFPQLKWSQVGIITIK